MGDGIWKCRYPVAVAGVLLNPVAVKGGRVLFWGTRWIDYFNLNEARND